MDYQLIRAALEGSPRQVPYPGMLELPEVAPEDLISPETIREDFGRMFASQRDFCIHIAFEMALDSWVDILERAEELGLIDERIAENLEVTQQAINLLEQGYQIHQSWDIYQSDERPADAPFDAVIDLIHDTSNVQYVAFSGAFSVPRGETEADYLPRFNVWGNWVRLLEAMDRWAQLQLTSLSRHYRAWTDREEYVWEEIVLPFISVYIDQPHSAAEREELVAAERVIALNEWWAECQRRLPIRNAEREQHILFTSGLMRSERLHHTGPYASNLTPLYTRDMPEGVPGPIDKFSG